MDYLDWISNLITAVSFLLIGGIIWSASKNTKDSNKKTIDRRE